MEDKDLKDTRLSRLSERISELRDTLNEICSASDDKYDSKERLLVSQCLDKLIVEYMYHIRDYK